MSKEKTILKPLSVALGATFAVTLAASNVSAAPAGDNPFAMSELKSGYMQLAGNEGKCGGKKETKEGKCGEGKKAEKEGKCGEGKKSTKEGKCGEGKCGGK